MLAGKLIHPDILAALARAGHGSTVVIADGNFPASTTLGPNAELVSLNLAPGVVSGTQVLDALLSALPVERTQVMAYATDGPFGLDADPPIWSEYRELLERGGADTTLDALERQAFYAAAQSPNVCLVIATGERALYANLILTIGVQQPEGQQ